MRENNFRAWDTLNEVMKEIRLINFKSKYIVTEEKEPWEIDFAQIELMQSTWLKDKNGVEIYEWELLWEMPNDFADPTLYEVVYHKEWFYLRNTFTNTIAINRRLSDMLIEFESKGNIYENPELIK